ncbi:MAG: dTDP-4-dehydrorhamnose reductase [Kofleriaceae bacterium]
MTILVTGAGGQLGRSLQTRTGVVGLDSARLDIRDEEQIESAFARYTPTVVINAAAYTAVDKAESEPALAVAVNRDGASLLALACARRRVRFLHVSSDYVFDGRSLVPYRENDEVGPLGVYGASKAEGEQRVHEAGGTVVRTSWMFGEGGPSFVHTMLRIAKERSVLRVVADQHGRPTYAGDLADALVALASRPAWASTYHFSNAGVTTWHAFAVDIIAEARRLGARLSCEHIEAITSDSYPMTAKRPQYSVLDTTRIEEEQGIVPPHWEVGLRRVVADELRARG